MTAIHSLLRKASQVLLAAALGLGLLGVTAPVADAKTAQKKSAKTTKVGNSNKVKFAQARGSHAKGLSTKGLQRAVIRGKNGKRRVVYLAPPPPKPSYGQLAGLHAQGDALDLKSAVALVVDEDTQEVLFRKNDSAVLPIASLTKLMTGLVISEARLSPDERIEITDADVDTEKGSRSRLKVGTVLTRGELMHLSLMSSENRAAHALGRSFPGGMGAFVSAMNAKARSLGMRDTSYVEPTGLSSRNQSSARDLALLTAAAAQHPTLRYWSTSQGTEIPMGEKVVAYRNTNRLTANPNWDIGLQKTGYISEAGQCLVMQTKVAGRKLIMVFLDSMGKYSRLGDAERVRAWLESGQQAGQPRG